MLSFGATKNGCLAVEAHGRVRPHAGAPAGLHRLHKRAGQLYSKMRFLSCQLEAYLEDGRWLAWAGHANAQATRLSEGLAAIDGIDLVYPVQANEIFLKMPVATYDALVADGIGLYPITPDGEGRGSIRLVTAFNTDPAAVDRVIVLAARA